LIKYLFFLLIPILIIPLLPDALPQQQIEIGKDYDIELLSVNGLVENYKWTSQPERILDDSWKWVPYILTEDSNIVQVETGQGSFVFDKNNCSISFYNKGKITGNAIIGSDSYTAKRATVETSDWQEVNQINNAVCQTVVIADGSNVEVQGIKSHAVGEFKIRYIKNEGQVLKTQLEVTNLSGLTDQKFGFTQTMTVPQSVKFGDKIIDLSTMNGTIKDRQWIIDNRAKVVELFDRVQFDFRAAFSFFSDVMILWDGTQASLVFNYLNNNVAILNGETLIIDPTFSEVRSDASRIRDQNNNNICDTGSVDLGSFFYFYYLFSTGSANDCIRSWAEWDTTSIPDGSLITDVDFLFDIAAVLTPEECDIFAMANQPSVTAVATVFTDIRDGTNYVNADTSCQTVGNNKSLDLGNTANSDLQTLLASNWFAIGISADDETLDGAVHNVNVDDITGTPNPTLVVEYTLGNFANAPTDLTAVATFFDRVTLDWTTPFSNGTTIIGYQINRTIATMIYPPEIILVNNTEDIITQYFDTGLTQNTTYAYRLGTWNNEDAGGLNASGNIVNVTTPTDFSLANFTAGSFSINVTKPIALDIRFEEITVNSTATRLNVTFSTTLEDMACKFDFLFARTSTTYTDLDSLIIDGDLNETSFLLNGVENEVIDIICWDRLTFVNGSYLITQTNLPIIQQIQNFQAGEFGTEGNFGAIDLVTLSIIIVAMIGFNRTNESVGIILAIALLGAMTWFGLITMPTIISGGIAITVMLVIVTTRKK